MCALFQLFLVSCDYVIFHFICYIFSLFSTVVDMQIIIKISIKFWLYNVWHRNGLFCAVNVYSFCVSHSAVRISISIHSKLFVNEFFKLLFTEILIKNKNKYKFFAYNYLRMSNAQRDLNAIYIIFLLEYEWTISA